MLINSPKEFAALFPLYARVMGLDVGEKTMGVAMSDAMRSIAVPLETIERKKFAQDMKHLKEIIQKYAVEGILIGYPINMDGSLGPRAQSMRTFVSNLEKHFNLPMILWDERMSTMAVERAMLEADLSRARRAQLVDKLAASYMLQGFLDNIK